MITYFLENERVMSKRVSLNSTITSFVGTIQRGKIVSSKNKVSPAESIEIEVICEKFDLEKGKYIVDQNFNGEVTVFIGESNLSIQVIEGIGVFDFMSEEPGKYDIYFKNETLRIEVLDFE